MRLCNAISNPSARRLRDGTAAFTFTELLVCLALFTFVIGGVVLAHLLGLRLAEYAQTKVGASDAARRSLSLLTGELRGARRLEIGAGNAHSFTRAESQAVQRGNAIQIYPTAASEPHVRYFLDLEDHRLKRLVSGNDLPSVVAHSITNQFPFACEDRRGIVLSNRQSRFVIALALQFSQLQDRPVPVGAGCHYDRYWFHIRVAVRAQP